MARNELMIVTTDNYVSVTTMSVSQLSSCFRLFRLELSVEWRAVDGDGTIICPGLFGGGGGEVEDGVESADYSHHSSIVNIANYRNTCE